MAASNIGSNTNSKISSFSINALSVGSYHSDFIPKLIVTYTCFQTLARMMLTGAQSERAEKKNARAGDSESGKPKRNKEKLIRLDDLIPKNMDIRGGRQLFFGAADTQQPTQIEKE